MDNLSTSSSSSSMHQSQPKHFCEICSAPFAHERSLKRHLRTSHNITPKDKGKSKKLNSKSSTSLQQEGSATSKFKCYICAIPFRSAVMLTCHLKNDHEMQLQCTDCKRMFKRPNYFDHLKIGCPQKLQAEKSPLIITNVVSLSSPSPQPKISESYSLGCVICAFSGISPQDIPKFGSITELETHKVVIHPDQIILTGFPAFSELNLNQAQFKNYCRAFLQSEVEFSLKYGSVCPYCQIKRSFISCDSTEFIGHLLTCHLVILVDKLKRELECYGKSEEAEDIDKEVQVKVEIIDLVDDDEED